MQAMDVLRVYDCIVAAVAIILTAEEVDADGRAGALVVGIWILVVVVGAVGVVVVWLIVFCVVVLVVCVFDPSVVLHYPFARPGL